MISENENTNELVCIWSANQIAIAAFLSGPFGGCYFLSKNYRILGKETYAKRCLVVGIIATVILFFANAFFEAPSGFIRFLIPFSYTMILLEVAKKFQGEQIKELLNSGAKRNSYFKLILISISFLILEFFIVGSVSYAFSIFNQII